MPPLNCPMLLMEIMHPNTSYTPWIRTVLPCSCTAAGDATCAHAGVRNTSRPSTAAALLGQAPRARILTPRLARMLVVLLVSKPGPFPQWEHGQGITRNSQIWVFPGWAGVGGWGGHPHRQSLPALHGGEWCHGRTAREARAEQSRGADTGGSSNFGGCRGGASPCPERAQWVLCVGAGDLEGTRRATVRLLWGRCPLLPLERAGSSHVLLSPSQVPPPRRGWAAPSPALSQPLPARCLGEEEDGAVAAAGLLWRGFGTCPLFASPPCCQEGEVGYGQRRLSPGSGGTVGGDSRGT